MGQILYIGSGFSGGTFTNSIAQDNNGKFYVVGNFISYNGTSANGIVRLNPNGTIDTGFNYGSGFSNVSGGINVVTYDSVNDKIYVGGTWTSASYNGHSLGSYKNIVRFNSNGTIDSGFTYSAVSGEIVLDIKIDSNNKIYALSSYQSAYKLRRINTNGSVDGGFALVTLSFGSYPSDSGGIAIDNNGKIYAVGNYTILNGSTTNNGIIRLNTDGTKDTGFNNTTGFNYGSGPSQVKVDLNNKVYVIGNFSTYKGNSSTGIVRIDSSGNYDSGFAVGAGLYPSGEYGRLLIDNNGKILATGDFTKYSGVTGQAGIVRLNTNGTKDSTFNCNTIGFNSSYPINQSIQDINNDLLVIGAFTSYNNVTYHNIVKLNPSGCTLTSNYTPTAPTVSTTTIPTSITCTGATSGGNVISGGTGTVTARGVCWNTSSNPTISNSHTTDGSGTGSFSSTITGLIPNTTYYVRAYATNSIGTSYGPNQSFTTLDPAPFSINQSVSNLSNSVSWSLNDPPYGTSIRPDLRISGTSTWYGQATLSHNATSYTYTGLSWNTHYQGRIVRIGTEYPSSTFGFSTLNFQAPSGLTVTGNTINSICLSWTNNSANSGVKVYYNPNNVAGWTLFTTVSNSTNHICVTGLNAGVLYKFKVSNTYSIYELDSNIITFVIFPPAFCSNPTGYTTTNATCGNTNGQIKINDLEYFLYYNFTVTDYIGHSYTVLNGTGICYVPAGYYKLTATPKTAYQYWYGSLPCIHDWIGITATNTSISNVMASIRQQTASYLISAGGDSRLVVTFSDAVTGHTYNYYLIKDDGSIVFSAITNNPVGFVKNPIDYGCYYGIIVNTWHSCTALLPLTCINQQLQQWFNLSGVKRVFLTPYSTNITWQNWKTSDEDYYVAGIDPLTFAGTKIKSFSGITGWYKLPTNADTTYTAPIDKVRQGFMYTHTLTLTFGQSDYVKWMDLYQLLLLTNRYIVVFEDNNDEWFCFGYQNVGGRTYVYQQIMETNTFMIQIKFFGSFMLTSLDKNYCINHILN